MTYVAPTLVDGTAYSVGSVWQPLVDEVERLSVSVGSEAWSDYTADFDWTASTTSPTVGSSTIDAWTLTVRPKLIMVRLKIDIGAGFSAGSGTYRFSIPSNANSECFNAATGSALVMDSGTAFRAGISIIAAASYFEIYADGVGGALGSSGPGTAWAAGDRISATICYEPA